MVPTLQGGSLAVSLTFATKKWSGLIPIAKLCPYSKVHLINDQVT